MSDPFFWFGLFMAILITMAAGALLLITFVWWLLWMEEHKDD